MKNRLSALLLLLVQPLLEIRFSICLAQLHSIEPQDIYVADSIVNRICKIASIPLFKLYLDSMESSFDLFQQMIQDQFFGRMLENQKYQFLEEELLVLS